MMERRARIGGLLVIAVSAGAASWAACRGRLKAAAVQPTDFRVSWIGNTRPSGRPVQSDLADLVVLPDGRVITNSAWSEAGHEACVYQNGRIRTTAGGTHGWGDHGGLAVAANSRFVYFGMRVTNQNGTLADAGTWPPKGTEWYGVSRRTLDDVSAAVPFALAKGGAGGTIAGSFLVVNQVPEGGTADVTGLAADDARLYVSNPHTNEVRIFDAGTMEPLGAFPVQHPGKLTLDRTGMLWIIQGGTTPVIQRYNRGGMALAQRITDVAEPASLSIDHQGRLIVSEAGPRQQILFYDISGTPKLVKTFGAQGGIYSSASGTLAPQKLISPVGAGTDASGNLYVGSSLAGADLRAFSPAGELLWAARGLEFIDTAVADQAGDGVDVYTKHEHFTLDYSKPAGTEWAWHGMTIDRLRYPNDPRLSLPHSSTQTVAAILNHKGHKYLFLTDQYSTWLAIFRFNGEIAVPSGMIAQRHIDNWLPGIQPAKGRWIWRDANGDGNFQTNEFADADGRDSFSVWGWDVDTSGSIWQINDNAEGVRLYPVAGTDSAGNLIYSRDASKSFGVPAPFTNIERGRYVAATDTLYLSGYTKARPIGSGTWGQAGTELARFDNWSKGNRTPRWRAALPYDPARQRAVKAFAVAGEYVFAGIQAATANESIHLFDVATGTPAGQLFPGAQAGSIGWLDASHGLQAFQRSNGEYAVFVEDTIGSRVLLYRF